ncbi:MAG: hypothetical protein ABI434_12220 [Burkholderiaceae bacterium]
MSPIFLRRHVFVLKEYFPQHNYIYHDAELPLPEFVHDASYDAIILDVTFLCMRWAGSEAFARMRNDYMFVKESGAVKLAFPQDEYDCSGILDDWMCDWNVDVVFSVLTQHLEVIYPKYGLRGEIRHAYTGYIDERLIDIPRRAFSDRPIDIGYRARKLPPYFGRLGETKWSVGILIAQRAREAGLATDIVVGDGGTLLGQAWLDMINNSKFTLGANSGSSMLDPFGDIQRSVKVYLASHPLADFAEVEQHCFSGQDGKYSFTAISPRVLEAGLLESGQLLVEGEYSKIIRPWEHYIPIRSDASDFAVAHEAMQDKALVARLIKDCRSALLDFAELRASFHASQCIDLIGDMKSRKAVVSSCDAFVTAANRYDRKMAPAFRIHWKRQAIKRRLARIINKSDHLILLKDSLLSVLRAARSWK